MLVLLKYLSFIYFTPFRKLSSILCSATEGLLVIEILKKIYLSFNSYCIQKTDFMVILCIDSKFGNLFNVLRVSYRFSGKCPNAPDRETILQLFTRLILVVSLINYDNASHADPRGPMGPNSHPIPIPFPWDRYPMGIPWRPMAHGQPW